MSEERLDDIHGPIKPHPYEVEDLRRRLQAAEEALAAEQTKAVRVMQRFSQHMEEFLSRLAHDLRNPLAPMQSAVEFLQLPDSSSAQRKRSIDIIGGQVRHLAQTLDSLLDFSRVVQGKIELCKEPVELVEVLSRVVEQCRPLMERKKHRLSVTTPGGPVWANADAGRLAQIILQMLDNAAKHTGEGGEIQLALAATKDEISLRVADNGAGIDPELLPDVFELFAKMDHPRTYGRPGLGIGLTTARKLTELLGGRMEAASSGHGRGSVFVIHLPRLADADGVKGAARETNDVLLCQPSRRILIVSDDEKFAEEWALLLRIAGQEIRTADTGAALSAALAFQPQAISLDVGKGPAGLPRRLREQQGLEKVMLVAMASEDKGESRRRAAEAGCDAFMGKPVKVRDFLRLLAQSDKR